MDSVERPGCPVCTNMLSPILFEDITVWVCENGCGGVWLDKTEYNKIIDKNNPVDEAVLNFPKNESIKVDTCLKRKCPKCNDTIMHKRFSSVKRVVEIDQCYQCWGIWLDYGELERIRNEFESGEKRNSQSSQFCSIYSSSLMVENSERELDNFFGIIDKILFFLFRL